MTTPKTMPPDEFELWTWTIVGTPVNSPACKAVAGMKLTFPQNGPETVVQSDNATYRAAWDATGLNYDPRSDQYFGVMMDAAAGGFRYVTISFDRESKDPRIHCYVSDAHPSRRPAPDDGSWTAGGMK